MAIKTNNSNLNKKLWIRFKNLPDENIRVLDAFAGNHILWNWIKRKFKHSINYFPIDYIEYSRFNIVGNNIKYLESLNLEQFDVIDLDAYGIPFAQLEIIFRKKYNGIVFITFIQSIFGGLPKEMLCLIGISNKMYDKCHTIFAKKGFNKFKQYLYYRGITNIEYSKKGRKFYCKINC